MLNKKLIAIAIAAGFSANAAAAIDTNTTTAVSVGTVTYANEAIPTLTAGKFVLDNASNALDILAQTGFSIPAGETRYMRVDLTGATFASVPTVSVAATATSTDGAGVGTPSTKAVAGSVAQGGSGASSVVFLITAPAAEAVANNTTTFDGGIAAANVATIASADFNVDPTVTVTAKYALYETAGAAIAQNLPLATSDAAMVTFATANTGDISTAQKATATVATQFKNFGTVAAPDLTEAVLAFTPGDAVTGLFIKQNGSAYAEADLFGGSAQNVTVTGNFTFGTWEFNDALACSGADTAVTLNTAKTSGVASINVGTTPQYLCVTVNGTTDVVSKGSYSVSTTTPAITATDVGSIVYDTTSISIPYVTTFGDYNQRVYIRNDSSSAASYTTSFVSEAGTTAVAGTKATGTVPGNSLIAIKASDLVTITGGTTRTSAVIEIEATVANITAVTQTVNLSDKSTDTVTLVVE